MPLFDTVKVVGGSVTLPFLTYERAGTIQGQPDHHRQPHRDQLSSA